MLTRLAITCGLMLAIQFSAQGQKPAMLNGTAPDYAGEVIPVYTLIDFITGTDTLIGNLVVDGKGNFSCQIPVKQTTYIFTRPGIYHAYLYIEPGTTYTIALPPKAEKTMQDQLNPFFEPTEVHLGIVSFSRNGKALDPVRDEELNFLVRMFADTYYPYFNKYATNPYTRSDFSELDSVIQLIEAPYLGVNNRFFTDYMTYRLGMLRHIALQHRSRMISDIYFLGKPVLYNNPAYMELFNMIYDKYLVYFGRTAQGKKVYDDIGTTRSYRQLFETLGADQVLQNDTLREMVILKNLHDGFYTSDFPRQGLLEVLDSLVIQSRVPAHRATGQIIRDKVTRLMGGYDPPSFTLKDLDGNMKTLADFRGKYVYLCFCTTASYTCIREYELLKRLQERHQKHIEIVTISADDDVDQMRDFIRRNNYNWVFLHYGNQPSVLKDYDIRLFPTYYFLDKDGKLIASPAPSPTENFEMMLFKILRDRGELY
jgi:peroxiredoxin